MKRRALISVSDKTGIVEFAKELEQLGFEVISTGGTYSLLEQNGVSVIGISDVTGFPEMLEGRVKTLHPNIHGGLLGDTRKDDHKQQMEAQGIRPIDVVVVNLYPFKETIAKLDTTFDVAIENIDIGGPSMLRSAAKNHACVTVVVDKEDYAVVLEELKADGATTLATRQRLAAKVFRHTAAYDALIASYLTEKVGEEFPEKMTFTFEKKQDLRYGENPHQKAAFYKEPLAGESSITNGKQLQGKELSYNNIQDANAALQIVKEFTEPAVVAVKHMNPCGVGVGDNIEVAYDRAYEADKVSIFGGIIAANREIDEATALKMKEIFLEIIIAPSFTAEALEVLSAKKNLRVMTLPIDATVHEALQLTYVQGGVLLQEENTKDFAEEDITIPTTRKPTDEEWKDLRLAWKVVKHVKSNAIVLAANERTIGIGAGQMNRVGSAKIAIEQAGELAKGSALASDAFFPMNDTVEAAAKAGVTAIIQPGGSIRDQDSIDKANEYGIAMVFTGMRHFKH